MNPAGPPLRLPGSYLVLELSGACDLACVHCSRSDPSAPRHPSGHLDPALADAVLTDLAEAGARFDTLILFWLGDPLAHPAFPALYRRILASCDRRGTFGKVEVHTNALLLDGDALEAALAPAATPTVWHLTLDAATAGTWRRIKDRNGFDRADANAARFVAERGRRGAGPRPVLQFILCDRNADEAAAFRDRWTAACRTAGLPVRVAAGHVPPGEGAVVFYRMLDCPTAEEQARQNAVFRETTATLGLAAPRRKVAGSLGEPNRTACGCHWKSPVIRWDGAVTVCTRDTPLDLALGNVQAVPFTRLWWGPVQAARRARVARRDYAGLQPCAACFVPRSANYAGICPIEIVHHTRWERTAGLPPGAPS